MVSTGDSPLSPDSPKCLQHSGNSIPAVTVKSFYRPWWMWTIANFDIVKSLIYLTLVILHIFQHYSGTWDIQWVVYFLVFAGITVGFLQGIGLRSGLKNSDDSATLLYCRMWMACQMIFVVAGIVSLFMATVMIVKQTESMLKIGLLIAASVYPILNFVLVYLFVGKLSRAAASNQGTFLDIEEN